MSEFYPRNNGIVQTQSFEGTDVRFIQEEDGPHFFLTDLLAYAKLCPNIGKNSFPERAHMTTQVVHTQSKTGHPQGRPVRLIDTKGALSFITRQTPTRLNYFKQVFLFDEAKEEAVVTINETYPTADHGTLEAITQDKQDMSWVVGAAEQIQAPLVEELRRKDVLIDKLVDVIVSLGGTVAPNPKTEFKIKLKSKEKEEVIEQTPFPDGYVGIPPIDDGSVISKRVVKVPHKAKVLPGPLGKSLRPEQHNRPFYPWIKGYATYKELFELYGYKHLIGTMTGRKVSQQLAALCRRFNVKTYLVADKYDPDHQENPAWCLVNSYPVELWDVVSPLLKLPTSGKVKK